MENLMQQFSEAVVLKSLEGIDGSKDLVIEQRIIRCLDSVASVTKLRSKQVVKIYKFDSSMQLSNSTERKCVFLIMCSLVNIRKLCSILRANPNGPKPIYILSIPYITWVAVKLLEYEGLISRVKLIPLPITLIPVDKNVVSLEDSVDYTRLISDQDTQTLRSLSTSLVQFEQFCTFGTIYWKGALSEKIHRQWQSLRESSERRPSNTKHFIDYMVIIDRSLDYPSVFTTQMTYTALLDDVIGFECGKCIVDKSITKKHEMRICLRDDCGIFDAIRDTHIGQVFGILSAQSKSLMGKMDTGAPTSIQGMKNFVSTELKAVTKLRNSLGLHIGVGEEIQKQRGASFELVRLAEACILKGSDFKETLQVIKECICRPFTVDVTLRLICLLSLTRDGIPSAQLHDLKRLMLQMYGYKYMKSFHALQAAGIITESSPSGVASSSKNTPSAMISKVTAPVTLLGGFKDTAFFNRAKRLGQLSGGKAEGIKSPGYIFNDNYSPLIAKVVDLLCTSGLDAAEKILGSFGYHRVNNIPDRVRKTIAVMIPGGVSYGEIASLRLVANIHGFNLLVASKLWLKINFWNLCQLHILAITLRNSRNLSITPVSRTLDEFPATESMLNSFGFALKLRYLTLAIRSTMPTQLAFLVDVSWPCDEETCHAIRLTALQLISMHGKLDRLTNNLKFGYTLFNSEGSRNQNMICQDFIEPSIDAFQTFETEITKTLTPSGGFPRKIDSPRVKSMRANSCQQLDVVRFALSRAVTDFNWHSVTVCSPVKTGRKRSQRAGYGEICNLVVLFSRLPTPCTIRKLPEALVTPSLQKCFSDNHLQLAWLHDSLSEASNLNHSRCRLIRICDFIKLAGCFNTEQSHLHFNTCFAPPSQTIRYLLRSHTAKSPPLATFKLEDDQIFCEDEVLYISLYAASPHAEDDADFVSQLNTSKMSILGVHGDIPTSVLLSKTISMYFAVNVKGDPAFVRLMTELRYTRKLLCIGVPDLAENELPENYAVLSSYQFLLKPLAESIGVLICLQGSDVINDFASYPLFDENISSNIFDASLLDTTWKPDSNSDKLAPPFTVSLEGKVLENIKNAYNRVPEEVDNVDDIGVSNMEVDQEMEETDNGSEDIPVDIGNEADLVDLLKAWYKRATSGRADPQAIARKMITTSSSYFSTQSSEQIYEKVQSLIDLHFKLSEDPQENKDANIIRFLALLRFELILHSTNHDIIPDIKTMVIKIIRKLIFVGNPRAVFEFFRDFVKPHYESCLSEFVQTLYEEFDISFSESEMSDEEAADDNMSMISSVHSFAEPLSGLSSMAGSVKRNETTQNNAGLLRRNSSLNLSQSQRQIEVPSFKLHKRKTTASISSQSSFSGSQSLSQSTSKSPEKSPAKRIISAAKNIPTTPNGKRILKTTVVPETPPAKQAPNRIRRTQEALRRRSQLNQSALDKSLAKDEPEFIDESPEKEFKTPVKTPTRSSTRDNQRTPKSERSKGAAYSKRLRFSPAKSMTFSSPSALSIMHLTTSPVIARNDKQ